MLTLFCPSRGRPAAASALLDSFNATKVTNAELVFLVDLDDETRFNYPGYQREGKFIPGPPTGDPTRPLNAAAIASKSEIVGFIGDDSRMETKGWDQQVLDALKTPGFCWGFDGTSPTAWPSTIFVSKRIVDALGYLALPTLHRGYFDVAWLHLANATKTGRVIPAMFRHDNSAGDPSSKNFKPEAQVPPAVISADEKAYKDWLRDGANDDIRKVRSVTELAHFFA